MLDAILDAVLDTLKLLPFLFITYLLMEYIEHKTSEKSKETIKKSGKFGPVIGSLLGAVPQCGFSVSATNLYAGRVITVGTTSVRALESMVRECQNGINVDEADGTLMSTEIFITPGYKFQNVDVLVTNFHQPRTTHLLLVEAFMGKQYLSEAYQHALSNNYRFLSYGDGMFIY